MKIKISKLAAAPSMKLFAVVIELVVQLAVLYLLLKMIKAATASVG